MESLSWNNQEKLNALSVSSGNIGIGTDNPLYELQILTANSGGDTKFQIKNDSTSANSDAVIQITSRSATGGNPLLLFDISSVAGSEMFLGVDNANGENFCISENKDLSSPSLTIENGTGNVGIGTDNPVQKLQVQGNAYISGNIGIGITNPSEKLHVIGDTLIDNTTTLTEDITSNLIAHYDFTEGSGTKLFDNVGGNDAVITGGTWVEIPETENIKAHYYLNNPSETSFDILPGTTVSNSTDLTISMWAYHNSGYGVNDYLLGMNGVAPFYGHIVMNSGNIEFYDGGVFKTICSEPSTNAWHQWTIVMSGVNITVYIDGVLCGTRSDFFDNNLYPLRYIGASAGGNQSFVGRLSDIRIFERAFSANEASDLYQDYQATGTVKIMNGNIGIGTNNPTSELDIRGNTRIINDNALALRVEKDDGTNVLVVDTINEYVGIGTDDPQTTVDINTTTGALILPRLTTTQRNALTGINGMTIYNTTTNKFQGYANSTWVDLH